MPLVPLVPVCRCRSARWLVPLNWCKLACARQPVPVYQCQSAGISWSVPLHQFQFANASWLVLHHWYHFASAPLPVSVYWCYFVGASPLVPLHWCQLPMSQYFPLKQSGQMTMCRDKQSGGKNRPGMLSVFVSVITSWLLHVMISV